jgi:hypothetical protein
MEKTMKDEKQVAHHCELDVTVPEKHFLKWLRVVELKVRAGIY